ncbi:uncharacterized protein FOMMEDRAFT_19367 [Fomitiporia mediterranea MF3/22]|uniref:uncharacterized protein n=1 Tax=Fomitiporia mediterranea (strain MF3/22) TaxID=694068 RepID=UPI0004407D2B|nr:uncharacterized protein FOMMEDRAFT_19367 [Fomitiporia mediterranea MF3/22]EJD04055.1 hypothetical protein FOMMEDRAFT_19367 [Fomitiporia mediterranea MF3/22]
MSTVAKKGPNPLLAAYVAQLATHPLRTKAITAGALCFIQEVLASHVANSPVQRPPKVSPRVAHALAIAKVDVKAFKMAVYGFFVSAPLGHVLVGLLQKVFAGRTGARARVAQILASNLLVAPIQSVVYLASMAIINGAKSIDDVVRTVKSGFMSVMRMTWITSPLAMVIAQKFLPQELWVPFFNLVGFSMGTYFTIRVKKARLLAEKAKKAKEGKEKEKENNKSE